jgi:hypothetical protein
LGEDLRLAQEALGGAEGGVNALAAGLEAGARCLVYFKLGYLSPPAARDVWPQLPVSSGVSDPVAGFMETPWASVRRAAAGID